MTSKLSLGKRTGAAKSSRHTKKYMRKGANVEDIIDSIHSKNREKATGGVVAELKDDDLFVIDREVNSNKLKITKKQQAALDKISRSIDKDLVTLPAPKAPPKSKIAKLPKGNTGKKRVEKVLKSKAALKNPTGKFDVWNTDLTAKVTNLDNEAAAEHYLRYMKKKQPNTPAKSIPSLLPAVNIAHAGASYNPEADEYIEYVNKIAAEEQKLIDQEKRIRDGNEPKYEKKVTYADRALELSEGLPSDPRYASDEEEEEEEEETVQKEKVEKVETQKETIEDEEPFVKTKGERLSKEERKKKARAEEIALEEKRRLANKSKEKDSHNVYRTKQITKELEEEEKKIEDLAGKRKRRKIMDKLTKRQRLGRGKFEEEEEPFLLQEELTGTMRQIRVQGNVLEDRMKSMQKRNMLPIGGSKAKKLKKTLKRKFVEKRTVQTVTKGSRVI